MKAWSYTLNFYTFDWKFIKSQNCFVSLDKPFGKKKRLTPNEFIDKQFPKEKDRIIVTNFKHI